MIDITFDTSCYDKESKKLFDELRNLQKQGKIKMWHEGYSEIETERWISPNNSDVKELFRTHSDRKIEAFHIPVSIAEDMPKVSKYFDEQLGYTSKELNDAHTIIDDILHPEGFGGKTAINKYLDGKILAKHIVRKRNYFVTKDKGFIKNDRKEKLEKQFPGLKIRLLNKDLIEELSRD